MNFYYEEDKKNVYIGFDEPLAYPAHFHKNIELVYITEGTARAFAGNTEYFLKKGDFFIAFPEVVHAYDNCVDMKATLIIISSTHFPEYSENFKNKTPQLPVIRNAPPEAKAIMKFIQKHIDTYDAATIRGFLLALFGILMPEITFTDYSPPSQITLQQIIRYCEHHYKGDITIDKMAQELKVSKSCISHTFSNKIHASFREYINTLRLRDALALLENTNKPITEIVLDSGFETIRTFNRVFKERYGMTPLSYRKAKKTSETKENIDIIKHLI